MLLFSQSIGFLFFFFKFFIWSNFYNSFVIQCQTSRLLFNYPSHCPIFFYLCIGPLSHYTISCLPLPVSSVLFVVVVGYDGEAVKGTITVVMLLMMMMRTMMMMIEVVIVVVMMLCYCSCSNSTRYCFWWCCFCFCC